jgi:hypothetical protein
MGHIAHLSHIGPHLKIFHINMHLIPFYGPKLPNFTTWILKFFWLYTPGEDFPRIFQNKCK